VRGLTAAVSAAAFSVHPSLTTLWPEDPLPPRPIRRPQTQPRAPHDPRHPETLTPSDDPLHRAPTRRRQDTKRSKSLPQALPRPQPLPTPRTPTNARLTFIEASLAQATRGLRAWIPAT